MSNADRMKADRDRVTKTLAKLSDLRLADLARRAGTRATKDASTSGPRGKGDHSDPTLGAVLRSMSGAKVADPVFDAVKDLAHLLNEMARMSIKVDDLVRYVTTGAEQVKASQTADCASCGRVVECTPADRLRSGLCGACYQAKRRSFIAEP